MKPKAYQVRAQQPDGSVRTVTLWIGAICLVTLGPPPPPSRIHSGRRCQVTGLPSGEKPLWQATVLVRFLDGLAPTTAAIDPAFLVNLQQPD